MSTTPQTYRTADISADGLFRYALARMWAVPGEATRWIAFCGLNPSTADGLVDDPTMRREIDFARRFGATGVIKVNICPYRSTDPKALRATRAEWAMARVREQNRLAIEHAAGLARLAAGLGVFVAWGNIPTCLGYDRDLALDALGSPLLCLGTTKSGEPRHPLYLSKTACPQEWAAP